ncbi:cation diffusion facilitator family transporter [Parvularcula lutaonensis]|uniref:Cation diffusion facilitator family transporter n=1 Tax=Parvularcula lutaonensis TaxID=491923 RepID=A0ABV7M972_9PROT|nr:cation diffusion facilitator family transporter [Parvularcula lutaonensis]GGY42834.1 cation transporter [Parvularcula lutaonensis]
MHGSLGTTKSRNGWAVAGTVAALCVAGLLIAAKAYAFFVSGSVAVLGSLADSALDLLGSAAAFFAVRYASQPPDDDHRFGHEKAEAVSALAQAFLISASALFIAVESIKRLVHPQPLEDSGAAIAVLTFGVVATVGLVTFQTFALRRSGSLVVEGDRAHYLGDVIAHSGALAAVFLSARFGFFRADAIAGLVAAFFLAWSVRELVGKALPQVMDQELPDEDRDRIIAIIDEEPEAYGFHNLRTRRSGNVRFVQMHLDMRPDLTLREAHEIADRVEKKIEAIFPDTDVIVHQDPLEAWEKE